MNVFKYCDKGAGAAIFLIRIVLGIIFLVHGADMVGNLSESVERMSLSIGISPVTAFLVCAIQFLGGAALIVGCFARFAAAGIAVVMVGAIITVHAQHGFFLQNHGYEYNLALVAMAGAVIFAGAGRWSVDSKFAALCETKLQRHSYQERVENETKPGS